MRVAAPAPLLSLLISSPCCSLLFVALFCHLLSDVCSLLSALGCLLSLVCPLLSALGCLLSLVCSLLSAHGCVLSVCRRRSPL
jgi:hypothetical protein